MKYSESTLPDAVAEHQEQHSRPQGMIDGTCCTRASRKHRVLHNLLCAVNMYFVFVELYCGVLLRRSGVVTVLRALGSQTT